MAERYAVVAYGEDGWIKLNSGDNKNSMVSFMSTARKPGYFAEGAVRLESIRLVDFESPRCAICSKSEIEVEGDEWLEMPGWHFRHRVCDDRLNASIDRNRANFAQAVLEARQEGDIDADELWRTLRDEAEANYLEAAG